MSDIKNRTVWLLSLFCLMLALSSISCAMNTSEASQNSILIKQLTGFPDEESGIRQGVSACYAGILDGKMVMAGGCNFPKTPVSEGGEKRFYKGVYLADIPQGEDTLLIWHKAGELPVQSAYGVSLTLPDGIICIGGTDGTTPLTSVYILRINSGRITIEYLPSLPSPLDNMGGALHGDTIYVAGGNLSGEPSNHLFMLDKKRPLSGWKELTPFPGYPRVQPVCAMQKLGREAYLYIWGGFAPAVKDNSATLTTSGYRYSITRKTWEKIATPLGSDANEVSLGGGSAIPISDTLIISTGGVNKDIFLEALQREAHLKRALSEGNIHQADSLRNRWKEYMQRPIPWYRFNDRIMLYDTHTDRWKELAISPFVARAGASLVTVGERLYLIGGELKPGIRTPSVTMIYMK